MSEEMVTGRVSRVAVITPAFNDWACLPSFFAGLDAVAPLVGEVHLYIIDDGSTDALDLAAIVVPDALASVEVVHLGCNLGHQRAIAAGLAEVVNRDHFDVVIVIDVDGEDNPLDVSRLWDEHLTNPEAVVVAQRRGRSEAIRFRLFYSLYKWLFRALTGRRLDFGNFALLPIATAQRLVLMTELWNHFPATVMRSRIRVVKVPLDRQERSVGRSRMNFTALVNHGLAGIAAFIDTVFVRLLVFVGLFALLVAILGGFALVATYLTSTPISGWLATALGLGLLGLLQMLAVLVVVTFLTLSSRSVASPPPSQVARKYIASCERIR